MVDYYNRLWLWQITITGCGYGRLLEQAVAYHYLTVLAKTEAVNERIAIYQVW